MKQIIQCFTACCVAMLWAFCLSAQPSFNRVEYYFDNDPGYGKATSISFTAGAVNIADKALNINPGTLSEGVHVLGIRARDANGAWSLDNKWLFLKPYTTTGGGGAIPDLSRVEYYFDNDPGYGNATPISFSPGNNIVDMALNINPSILSEGVHVLGIRVRDANGAWSLDNKWLFLKPYSSAGGGGPVPNFSLVEYYLDNDPGYGNATAISFSTGNNIVDLPVNINPSTLAEGVHVLGIRAKDANGGWSLDNKWLFLKSYAVDSTAITAPNLKQVEYYIDKDPGYGKAVPVAINNVTNLPNFSLPVNISGLTAGSHKLYIRSKDAKGGWSLDNRYIFTVSSAIAAPAIVVNSITKKTLCAKDTLAIAYQKTGTYSVGNTFSVQLSDAAGSFTSPTVIGTVTDTSNRIVQCALPAHIADGSLYRVRVVSSNPVVTGITGSDSIVIHDAPVAQTITGAADANVTFTYTYSVPTAAGSTWAWIAPAATITQTASSADLLWNTAGTQTVKVLETNQYGCKGDTSSKNVNVYVLAIDSVKSSSLIPCKGSSIIVTAKVTGVYNAGNIFTAQLSNASGLFTSPVNIGTLAANPTGILQSISINAIIPVNTANGTNYRVRILSSSPLLTSADNGKSIKIQKPVLGNDTAIVKCAGNPVNLTLLYNTTGLTTQWNTPRPDSITASGVYQLIAFNSNGCSDTAVVTVTINPLPATPVITPSGPVTFCQGGSVTLTSDAATSYLWSTGATTQSIVVTSSGTYTVTVSNASGCTAVSAVTTVTVNPVPAVPIISAGGSTTNVCPGKTVTLTSSSATSYLWSNGATTQSIVVTAAGNYSVTVGNGTGCTSTSLPTVVTYLTCAKPIGLVTGNITSASTKISWAAVTCAAGYQYEWRVKGTIPYTVGQQTGITKILTGLLPATTYQWRVVTACKVNPDTITSAGYTNGPEFTTLATAFTANDGSGTMDVKMENENLSATVMPNPANNIATVKVTNAAGKVCIRLTDLSGKTLWQNNTPTLKGEGNAMQVLIPVKSLAAGTYIVMVKDEKETKVMKLIKE